MNKLARMCMVFCTLLFLLFGIARADETAVTTETYTVKRGDWLAKIARKFDRTDYVAIAKANNLANPDLIHIGQVLMIPPKTKMVAVASKRVAQSTTKSAKPEECAQNSESQEIGIASWYGIPYHGRRTASGEIYDMNALTVAHPTLPLGTTVCITSKQNGASVVAKVNDRGPFIKPRIIDLSKRIARLLGIEHAGIGMVSVSILAPPSTVPRRSQRQHVVSTPPPRDAQAAPILSVDRVEANIASVPPEITLGYIDKEMIRAALVEVIGEDHDPTLLTEHLALAIQMKIIRETHSPPNIPTNEQTALNTQKEEWPTP